MIRLEHLLQFKFLMKAHHELKPYAEFASSDFDGYISNSWFKTLMEYHEYKIIEDTSTDKYGIPHYWDARTEYYTLFDKFLFDIIMMENNDIQKTFSKKIDNFVKVVNKRPMIYSITVSPPPSVDWMTLRKVVADIRKMSGVKYIFGVYEAGNKNGYFHAHFQLMADKKDTIHNVRKALNRLGYIHDVNNKGNTPMNPVNLLKTMRYYFKPSKKNVGLIDPENYIFFKPYTSLRDGESFLKDFVKPMLYKDEVYVLDGTHVYTFEEKFDPIENLDIKKFFI